MEKKLTLPNEVVCKGEFNCEYVNKGVEGEEGFSGHGRKREEIGDG